MKYHTQAHKHIAAAIALIVTALLALGGAAAGADTKDQMIAKIVGRDQPTAAPPYAMAAHALVGKDNSIAVSAWNGSLVFEGRTFNAFSTTLAFGDATADRTVTFANATGTVVLSTLGTNAPEVANSLWTVSNGLALEGATADAYETTLAPTNATADRTITLPDATGTVVLAQASTAVSLTADNQAVTPGSGSRIQLASDNATAANRTFTLSATGAITGQVYILIGPASNQCELADTGIQKLAGTWTPGATDTLSVLFDGTNFIEVGRGDN